MRAAHRRVRPGRSIGRDVRALADRVMAGKDVSSVSLTSNAAIDVGTGLACEVGIGMDADRNDHEIGFDPAAIAQGHYFSTARVFDCAVSAFSNTSTPPDSTAFLSMAAACRSSCRSINRSMRWTTLTCAPALAKP